MEDEAVLDRGASFVKHVCDEEEVEGELRKQRLGPLKNLPGDAHIAFVQYAKAISICILNKGKRPGDLLRQAVRALEPIYSPLNVALPHIHVHAAAALLLRKREGPLLRVRHSDAPQIFLESHVRTEK